ncbi:YrdB family protein [Fictibacillus barbaricus]|uniref:DUF2568 domain-containing protein n=1 Tax=Fictibacillus barbaricus TaxID=182136 RepID=A0ABU1U1S7_9BACL|nr:YrdB family protein [Fictibacillus barbaricus]MDR7073434.1 hypothetical protein [Fictibacillus barbaricus]
MISGIIMITRFVSELLALWILRRWGYDYGNSLVFKWVFAMGTPFIFAIIWGLFASPKAHYQFEGIYKIFFEIVLFSIVALALYTINHHTLAGVYWMIAVLTALLIHKYKI